ncbi:MAG: gamma carbonic anhydrase family protein [Pirellulales bacterium]
MQDCCVLHADYGFPCQIGEGVTIGHGAIVHGAVLEDNVLVGMNAVVQNGAVVGRDSIIGVGAVVKHGMEVPPGSLVVGVPGKVRRQASEQQIEMNRLSAAHYVEAAAAYLDQGIGMSGAEVAAEAALELDELLDDELSGDIDDKTFDDERAAMMISRAFGNVFDAGEYDDVDDDADVDTDDGPLGGIYTADDEIDFQRFNEAFSQFVQSMHQPQRTLRHSRRSHGRQLPRSRNRGHNRS